MQQDQDLSELVSQAIQTKLLSHKDQEQQHIDALLSSQKHLTSNLRTLINSLDRINSLATPKFNSGQSDMLRNITTRAHNLQAQLANINSRLQKIQAHLLPEQQQQEEQQQQQ